MAVEIKTTLSITGDRELLERMSNKMVDTKLLMRRIGILAGDSARERLRKQQDVTDGVLSGRLMASITPGRPGNIFEVSNLKVTFGTNVRYAAQRQFGGLILPKNAKALAIPLKDSLKRDGIGPREIAGLIFVPTTGGKPNVFAVLVAGEETPKEFGTGPLFALASSVNQPARPYLFWSEEDWITIRDGLFPLHLA